MSFRLGPATLEFGPNLRPHACLNPEMPPNHIVQFDLACKGCRIALEAAIAVEPPPGAFDGWWRRRLEVRQLIDEYEARPGATP